MRDDHGDRMKYYEKLQTSQQLMRGLPIYARFDGVGFSKFTKPFEYPYDKRLRSVFDFVCIEMVKKYNLNLAYHQSDEISILFNVGNGFEPNYSEIIYNGGVQKLASILTSKLTSLFTIKLNETFPELKEHIENNPPCFDCRVFNLPNLTEAVNEFVWRERDCTKNSVSMLARHYCSHKELQGKSRNEMLDMIVEKGDNWNNWDSAFKRGTYFSKRKVNKIIDGNPCIRTEVYKLDIPPITKVANKVGTLVRGEEPESME